MTKWYIDRTCLDSPVYDDGNFLHFSRSQRVADASAAVSGDLPLNESKTFASFELFENDNVLFFDYASDAAKSRAFDRMSWLFYKNEYLSLNAFSALMSKLGVACTSEETICGLAAGVMAEPEDVCRFAEKASGRVKTEEERALIEVLSANGSIFIDKNGRCIPREGVALIAVSRMSSQEERRVMFHHEYSHALFHTSVDYANALIREWRSLSITDRLYIISAMTATGMYKPESSLDEAVAYSLSPLSGHDHRSEWQRLLDLDRGVCATAMDSIPCSFLAMGYFNPDPILDSACALYMAARPYMPDID